MCSGQVTRPGRCFGIKKQPEKIFKNFFIFLKKVLTYAKTCGIIIEQSQESGKLRD